MDIRTAARRAREFLWDPDLDPADQDVDIYTHEIRERAWCFVFGWNSVEYMTTGNKSEAIIGVGPVVVPKDGSPPFTLGSQSDASSLLDDYEREKGIPSSSQEVRTVDQDADTSTA